jgi:hypothetical protein
MGVRLASIEAFGITFFYRSAIGSENSDLNIGSFKADRNCYALYWDDIVDHIALYIQTRQLLTSAYSEHQLSMEIIS